MPTIAEKKMVSFNKFNLDGYLLNISEGDKHIFGLSQTQLVLLAGVTEDTNQASKRYIEITKSKMSQSLVPQGFAVHRNVFVNEQKEKVNLVQLESVVPFLTVCLALGYTKAAVPLAILGSLGLYQLFCDEFDLETDAKHRARYIEQLVPHLPTIWECRYPKRFWLHLERLTTYRKGNPQCAFWINKYIYDRYPDDIRARLEEVNPLVNGIRANRIHQHFKLELLESLQWFLDNTFFILEVADDKAHLQQLYNIRFKDWRFND